MTLYDKIYAACLEAASKMTVAEIRQMSWFGSNHPKR
jgi:hypothetical protein